MKITETGTYTWKVQPSGGAAPLSHYWRYRRTTAVHVGTNSPLYARSVVVGPDTAYIFRLTDSLTDASTPVQGVVTRPWYVEVYVPGGGGTQPLGGSLGVRLENGTCGPRPPSGPLRQAWLAWVFNHGGAAEPCAVSWTP